MLCTASQNVAGPPDCTDSENNNFTFGLRYVVWVACGPVRGETGGQCWVCSKNSLLGSLSFYSHWEPKKKKKRLFLLGFRA